MIMDEKYVNFLVKLEKISRETGVAIGGCGCCGSPFLVDLDESDISNEKETGYCVNDHEEHIEWLSPDDTYNKTHKTLIKRSHAE